MASSSSFITGRARSGSIEDERNNNFEYNKGIINIENIKPLPGNDPYKSSPSGQYRVGNDTDFRGTLAPQEDYRLNSGNDYRGGTTPSTDFNRSAIGVDYRNDLRPPSSNSYDYRGAYRENMPGEGGGYNKEFRNSTEDLSRGTNANSGEYSPGGTRMSSGGANSQYPAHFWNYINGIPSRR